MAGGTANNDDDIISGINVTPLVDIMLVLLIIFIVEAKDIVSQSIPMDLPKAATGSEQQDVFSVELGAAGETVVNGNRLATPDAVLPLAREAKARTPDVRAVIKADGTVQHARVIRVMDLLKQAGVTKVAFGVSQGTPETAPTGSK